MMKRICKLLSAALIFALLLQMLPMQAFAANYRDRLSDKIVLPDISATDQAAVATEDEILSKRTAYSKEYKVENGQNMAVVYPVDVHYQTEDGWEEIDNTLQLTEGKYTNTAGLWEVSLPQQLSKDTRISISKDGYTMRFGMAGQLRLDDSVAVMSLDAEPATKVEAMGVSLGAVTPQKAVEKDTPSYMAILSQKNSSQLSYADVYENTDVVYDLQGNKVKESIVIGKYDSDLVGYRYVLEVGALNPVLKEDGRIDFYDADNKNVVMVMQAPFLIDDNGEQTNDIKVTLTGKDGTYYLTYTLPRQWLAQEERAYPVILDPFVTPSLRYYNIMDVTVGDVVSSSWNWAINEVGYYAPRGVQRVYLKFNQIPELTSADVITHAQIQMYKPYTFTRSAAVEVHKVLETWEEYDMTWATKPDISDTVEDYNIIQEEGNYIWEITDIARDWYAGENTGMLFKTTNEAEAARTNNWYQFHASDMGDDSIILVITYRNNTGLESYWDYTGFSAGRAGSGYVNNFTGNLTWTRADLGFGGTRAAVAISHVYSANDAQNNLYGAGYGWRTSYNQRVYQWSENANYYIWEDGDGTQHYFYKESTGVYKDEDGLELVLKTTGSGNSKYTITDKGGNVSHFDTKGRLTQIVNNQETPSPVTVTYINTSDYRIDTVTDAVGRRYVYTYPDGLLTKIEARDRTGRLLTQVTYGYTNGLLTSITDKDGETVSYTYSSENLLTRVEDIDSYRLAVVYNTTAEGAVRRVAMVSEFDGDKPGGEMTFTYAQNQTTIEDYSGNKTVYQFNNWGNTVSIQDGEGRAQYAQYATDTNENGKGNQLTAASKLQNTVTNLFADSSFENDTLWEPYEGYDAGTITTSQAYHGNKSVQLMSTDGADMDSPWFTVGPGETYSFSFYIKLLSGEAEVGFDGPSASNSEWLDPNEQWERVQVSYTNSTQQEQTVCSFVCVTGEAYVDCVQLEESPTASRYNFIDNGDFTGTGGWTATGMATGDGISAPAQSASWLKGQAYKITGDPAAAKSVSQEVAVSGNEGDTFVLAGWAQGDGVPLENGTDQRSRAFGLKAVFHHTDDTTKEFTVSFNPDTPYWQYAAVPLVAEKDYSSITVTLQYAYGMNTVYFDGIGLYKEQFSSSYVYDENGNVTSVKDLQEKTTTYEYQNNNLTKEILPDNTSMTYTYDDHHNVLTATSSTGLVYTFTYDTYGNNTSVSLGTGDRKITSTAIYTTNGNALSFTTDSTGHTTNYLYNEDTNVLEWVYYPEDDLSTREVYLYDEMYRVTDSYKGSMANAWVQYDYTDDLLTNISKTGANYTLNYGAFDLLSSVQVGTQTLASYAYEPQTNRLTGIEYENEDSVEYTYDTQGRITKDTYEDGDTVSYLYDKSGSLATVIDSGSGKTTIYYYDFINRLAKYLEEANGLSHTVEYVYDAKNNLSTLKEKINDTLRTTDYSYDGDNRLETITGNGHTVEYTYDEFGRLVTQKVKNGSDDVRTTTYTYRNPKNTTTSTQIKKIEHIAGNYSVTYTYTYDGNGNILSINDGTNTITYEYDVNNQLTRENDPIAGISREYQYRSSGQMFLEAQVPYTTGNLSWYEPTVLYTGDSNWEDMLVDVNGHSISRDEIGNMLSYNGVTYTWEHGRELATLADSTGTWAFTYDANGMRTKKVKTNTSGTVTDTYNYVYNGSQLMEMTKPLEKLEFFYDGEGRPFALRWNENYYYYVTNLQGDVIAILDSTGTMVVNYHYDAYGVLLQTGGTMATTLGTLNPLTYRGYVYDHETGLYYLQSRYYNPTIRQFISPDAFVSTGQGYLGYNMFAYCGNNPVNMADPTGELGILTWLAIGAAVLGIAAAGHTAAVSHKYTGEVDGVATITAGVGTFMAVYSLGLYAYDAFCTFATYYGYVPASNSGSTPHTSSSNTSTNMQHVANKGKMGEELSGITKNTTHIPSATGTARYRIPDGLSNSTLSEVKNYSGTLSYTNQLKDFVSYAQSQVPPLQIHLHTNAKLTGPLQQLVDSGIIQVFPLE